MGGYLGARHRLLICGVLFLSRGLGAEGEELPNDDIYFSVGTARFSILHQLTYPTKGIRNGTPIGSDLGC